MLGRIKFALRQGFACGKTLVRRKCAAPALRGTRAVLYLDLLHDKGFDDVAFLDVLELLEGNTALVAGGDLLHAVLKALQGGDGTVIDDNVVCLLYTSDAADE